MAGYIGSSAAVSTSGVERKKTFAIATTTTSLTGVSYTPNFVHVYHNGIRLVDGTDYTATNGTSVTLVNAAENGDEVVVVSYATFSPADTYSIAEADAEFLNDPDSVITVSGSNVGIGTSSPSAGYKLDVNGAATFGGSYDTGADTNGGGVNIGFNTTDGGNITALDPAVSWYPLTIGASEIKFGGYGIEVGRFDAGGNLLVGKTVADTETEGVWLDGSNGRLFVTADDDYTAQFTRNGSDGVLVYWYNDTAQAGTITISGSSCSYNTSSDYRLKTDLQPMTGASDRVQALKPVNFKWIADGTRVDGFLAHEAQEVVPECATGTKDAMRDEEYKVTPAVEATYGQDGNVITEAVPAVMGTRSVPDYQGIDQSKLVPLLTAALQEALTEIAALKVRVAALEVTT